MTHISSSYSSYSESQSSDYNSDQISPNVIINNNNVNANTNPYRTSLYFEYFHDPKGQTRVNAPVNIIDRSSTHSFMVFIDDSRYGDIPSQSTSLWSSNTSNNCNANTGRSNTSIIVDGGNIDSRVESQSNDLSTYGNYLNDVPSTSNTNPSHTSKSHKTTITQSSSNNEGSSIVQQQGGDDPSTQRKITPVSINTGETEYFEANEFLVINDYLNGNGTPLLPTNATEITSDVNNNKNKKNARNRDSTDSAETQDTEILNTDIRNSQSFIQSIRDSVKTLSTIVFNSHPLSSITTNENKHVLNSMDQKDEILNLSISSKISGSKQLIMRNESPSLSVGKLSNFTNYMSPRNSLQTNIPSPDVDLVSTTDYSNSPLFHYDHNYCTIEPDVRKAVKLLKSEIGTGTSMIHNANSNRVQNSISNKKFNQNVEEGRLDKDNFIPHEFKIRNRLPFSQPPAPIMIASEPHVPKSPSLINNVLVPSSQRNKVASSYPPTKLHKRIASLTNYANVTPQYRPFSVDTIISDTSSTHFTPIPKIHVLQSVSGSKKWKFNPKTESRVVSMVGPNEFKSPIKKLSFHEDKRNSIQEYVSKQHPNFSDIETMKHLKLDHTIHEAPTIQNNIADAPSTTVSRPQTIITPPLPTGISMFRYNTTTEIPKDTGRNYYNNFFSDTISIDDDNDNGGDIKNSVYIQHIDSPSIHSVDSQSYKFWEVYSIERVFLLLAVGFIFPPLFFMIYLGPTCGIDDCELMKLVLNKEHRIGIFRGFLWDIDLSWLRTLSLLLGSAELIIVFACVCIGFGVGLTS